MRAGARSASSRDLAGGDGVGERLEGSSPLVVVRQRGVDRHADLLRRVLGEVLGPEPPEPPPGVTQRDLVHPAHQRFCGVATTPPGLAGQVAQGDLRVAPGDLRVAPGDRRVPQGDLRRNLRPGGRGVVNTRIPLSSHAFGGLENSRHEGVRKVGLCFPEPPTLPVSPVARRRGKDRPSPGCPVLGRFLPRKRWVTGSPSATTL